MVNETSKVDIAHKRKRINRIKVAIIVTIVILFTLPTILCILLGIRLGKLQRQVDSILSTYSSGTLDDNKQKSLNGNYAFASTNDSLDGESQDEGYVQDNRNSEDTEDEEFTEVTDITGDDNYSNDEELNNSDLFPLADGNNQDITYNSEDSIDPIDGDTPNTTDPIDDISPEGIYYGKKVYLTFDDGPTYNTDLILDILDEYNVKATFFVIGHTDEVSKERYRRIVNEGHILGMHSYSHKYKDIYKSIEDFDKDFTKLWKLLYDTTGYTPNLYRFPGGSLSFVNKSKIKDYVNYLDDKGMTYYDWNVVNGDAEGKDYTEEEMIDYLLNGVARKNTSIVLMHDGEGKDKTVATLPAVLDALITGGAEVLPMDENVQLIQQIKAKSVK